MKVVHPLETHPHADRPGQGTHSNIQFLLELIHKGEGVLPFPVQFIDENNNRRVSHPADFHQFFRLLFHPLSAVHNKNGAVYGGKGPIGILHEVLMPRSIQNIYDLSPVLEGHYRCPNGYAPLLLNLHKVGSGAPLNLVGLHRPGHMDSPAEEKELLRQGGLPRVGMTNDPEGPSFFYFFYVLITHVVLPVTRFLLFPLLV